MASTQSPEARELALVGKLEMRIALADSDKKLADLLNTYLAPLLLKLASESVVVRNKVIAICQHINTRIKPHEIKLPVAALLKQFKENTNVALIRHFDILYIQQGILRLPVPERLDLLPILIQNISRDYAASPQHAAQLFHLTLRLLAHFKLPARGSNEDSQLRSELHLDDQDAQFLSRWFGKLLLLTPVRQPSSEPASAACPGLSTEEYAFLTLQGKPDAWDATSDAGLNLTESKILVARLLASGLFTADEKFLPALFASADTNSRISDVGEDVLKRVLASKDLEDKTLVGTLLTIYFGSPAPNGALPVKIPLRIKIIGILCKSATCAQYPKEIAKIVEGGLLSPELSLTNRTTAGREASKFRSAIFSLVNFIARQGSSEHLSIVAEGLVGNLKGFIQDQGWPTPDLDQDMELRGYGYETIGLLAKASPTTVLLEPDLNLLLWLFRSLREDTSGKDVAVSIEQALSSVLEVFSKSLDASVRPKFRKILTIYSSIPSSSDKFARSTQYVATKFANRCLAYDDVLARWIDILAISGGNKRQEVLEEGRKGLDPYWFDMSNSIPGSSGRNALRFPDLDELVQFIFTRRRDDEDMDVDSSEDAVLQARRFQEHFPDTVSTVIKFCTEIAMHTALADQKVHDKLSEDWGRKLETLMSTDLRARQAFRTFAALGSHKNSLAVLIRASFNEFVQDELSDSGGVGSNLVHLLSLSPEDIWTHASLLKDYRALEPSIFSNNMNRRLAASHAYGLLASHSGADASLVKKSSVLLKEKIKIWRSAVGGEINQINGAIIALGYYFSRLKWRSELSPDQEESLYQLLETVLRCVVSPNIRFDHHASVVSSFLT